MALQGPLGFYSFLAEVRPLRSRCQVRCSTLLLSNPPYFAPYPSLPLVSIMVTTLGCWLVKSETVPQGECHPGADCHGYTLLLQ